MLLNKRCVPTCCISVAQGPKPADRLAKGEAEGAQYDYEERINFAVFPSLQVWGRANRWFTSG